MTTTRTANIHPYLIAFTLWITIIATCLVVANIYYNQPLLADIAHTFNIPEARNRLNTVYMASSFIGGASGSFLASQVWKNYQWTGVCAIGTLLSAIAFAAHLINYRKNVRN